MYKWSEMSPRERDALVWTKVMGGKIPNPPYISVHFPKYSTDISAAWEVVEEMKRTRTWAHVDSLKSGKWSAHFGQFDFSFAEADTAPEAICLAALRAVGVEIE